MRVKQPLGTRGSLQWVQAFVNRGPAILEKEVRTAVGIAPQETFDWRSPRHDDDHAEYRDSTFLERLGLMRLTSKLSDFWPTRGPQ